MVKSVAVPLVAEHHFEHLQTLMNGVGSFHQTYDGWLSFWAERQHEHIALGYTPVFLNLHVPTFALFLGEQRASGNWHTLTKFLMAALKFQPHQASG